MKNNISFVALSICFLSASMQHAAHAQAGTQIPQSYEQPRPQVVTPQQVHAQAQAKAQKHTASYAKAATYGRPQIPQSSLKGPQRSEQSNYELQSDRLAQMVDLPGVPQYTGRMTFITGTRFPYAKGGASLTLELKALETADQVKDWYSAALQQSGWKLDSAMSNANTVAAWQNKKLIQVITRPVGKMRHSCDVVIRYKYDS
ncbi:MAG: hypothetical protein C0507_17490 [Cyanobacteria bacterium PR.3.49]|nr:hypothetical protein [Cyanobacteria bacterium PR.3.49]